MIGTIVVIFYLAFYSLLKAKSFVKFPIGTSLAAAQIAIMAYGYAHRKLSIVLAAIAVEMTLQIWAETTREGKFSLQLFLGVATFIVLSLFSSIVFGLAYGF